MEFVDTETAATELKVSPALLRQLARAKKIPFYRLSARTLRFDLAEVREHMRLRLIGEGKENSNKRHARK